MDAVILAGGRGGRVTGLVPPYHKPLLPVNGQPNIRNIVHHIAERIANIIVVTAPENTAAIHEALVGLPAALLVQRSPSGPGHALKLGVRLVTAESFVVLLSDNVISPNTLDQLTANDRTTAISVQHIPREFAEPFTRLDYATREWVEKVPIDADQLDSQDECTCWVGPLLLETDRARKAHLPMVNGHESLIGPHLHELAPDAPTVTTDAIDIGTIENYRRFNGD